MSQPKVITVFSEQGDPEKIRTWSNVPYFLVKTLREMNITVNTVDLSPQGVAHKILRKVYNMIFSRVFRETVEPYSRSILCYHISNFKIKRAVAKYSDTDVFIFTTFSFSAKRYSSKPSVLFCDWTLEHYVNYFLSRESNFLERGAIRRQNMTIESADSVFVLFPAVADQMRAKFRNPRIYYNGNVINSSIEPKIESITSKVSNQNLLFIGSVKYKIGAEYLIAAFTALRVKFSALQLHIVGISQNQIPNVPEGVKFYGYLNKGIDSEATKYYELLNGASIFINTNPKWASFSSSVEAMYFYTPLIVTRYQEFVETFGEEIDFGYYFDHATDRLDEVIENVLSTPAYKQLCMEAHKASRSHTWPGYVERMLKLAGAVSASLLIGAREIVFSQCCHF